MSHHSPPQPPGVEDLEVEGNVHAITLSSDGHATLFYHDEEIISNFHAQINVMNQHTLLLEQKLHSSNEDCESAREQLYESEIARYNELQSRTAFQRHLQLEQHRYSECTRAYQSLHLQHSQMTTDMEAIFTFNEMLRQEVEHSQFIIESMAEKIATFETAAEAMIKSLKERSTEHLDAVVAAHGPEPPAAIDHAEPKTEARSPEPSATMLTATELVGLPKATSTTPRPTSSASPTKKRRSQKASSRSEGSGKSRKLKSLSSEIAVDAQDRA
ncbi:uncharacterized protein BP5553_10481 [Venustampulla echinocandica]|uniref:Uncharacterized protein n=1 Tax=Venustampulla echinocandica TaxID=2656787 RepID=A0A370T9G4_9HELO|nr:uncharacterized protein BP5553_10481 [Venustampulla echinocandica]RDL30203.1 hypothetical protein BP5553_10481 [Venustampulla echinocandica]